MRAEDENGDLQKSYVFHPGWGIWQAMLAEVPGDDPSTGDYAFYHMDMHGSMRQARDEGGALIAAQDYEPYGWTLLAVGTGLSHGYTGHPQSTYTGLYTTYHRMYNPGTGQWLNRDPLRMLYPAK